MAALAVSTTVSTVFAAGGGESSDTIKIGAIVPLSGATAEYGIGSRKGMEMAIAEINAAGGVNGKQVQLIVEDDEGNPEKTVNAFTKLTSQDKVKFIVGSLTSGTTAAIGPRAQASKVVLISPSATNIDITRVGDFVFRACFIDPFQGTVSAKFVFNDLKAKKVALFYDNGNDYCVGITDTFRDTFKQLGGTIVADEAYLTGDVDFNAQITKIKAAAPDLVFAPDYYATASLLAKQLRAQGVTAPLMGADGWDGVAANSGDEVLGSFYTAHYAADSSDELVKKFVADFSRRYNGEIPLSFCSLGYDCVKLIADAIKKAGSVDSTAVRNAMAATNGRYVTGNFKFDQYGDPIKSAQILEIVKQDGKLKEVYRTTVNP
jgi:branched-chain amino acid transport system substrate-binding protein